MKKTYVILSLIVLGILMGTAQPLTEIRILSEDQRSVVLEFKPQIKTEQVSGSQGTLFTRFRFFESQVAYDSNGRADFFRAILLLLPSPKYSLQVVTSEFQIREAVRMVPKPTIKLQKDFGITESYDETVFSQTIFSTTQTTLAELVQGGKTGWGYIGTLKLHPIQAIDKEKVKVYSRIVIRLDFAESFTAGLLSSCLLRGDVPQKTQLVQMTKKSSLQTTSNDSPLAQGEWYRIEVQTTGMYKLDYAYFRGLNISVQDINSMSIYGNGGLAIPDDKTGPADSLVEIPRLVIRKKSDGSPDPEDYVVFYGRGVRSWLYRGGNTFEHVINPYTENNYYFFTFSKGAGRQMDSISGFVNPSPAYVSTHFQEKVFIEQERYNLLNSGRRWVGKLFIGTDNTAVYRNPLPGLIDSLPITYRFKLLHRSESEDVLKVFENEMPVHGSVIMGVCTTDVDVDVSLPYANSIEFPAIRNNSSGMLDDESIVKFQVESSNEESKTWLDWFEIFYNRKLEAVSDALFFTTSPDMVGAVQYGISNLLSSEVYAFDVTNHRNVKKITQLQIMTDGSTHSCNFQLSQVSGNVSEIAVMGKNGFLIPSMATRIENSNIHRPATAVEFIIISPPEFLSEANRLRDYRVLHDSLNTLVVDINQIYNEFSGGLPDPLAIREFLRYTRDNWESVPKYVLLFGGGHFDYKNISTSQRNWIPPYETVESIIPISTYPSDDKFVILDPLPLVTYAMAIGRLPARSLREATVMVNKIISYDTTSPDSWRNRITFVADDGKTSQKDEGDLYTTDSEDIAESETYIPKNFEKKKIYIVEYPTVNSASGRKKPDANRAIVDAINQGTLITNYIGHGNERVWTHETVFTREDNIPQLTNRDRLTFVVAATCSNGKYDNPNELSTTEQLVTMEQGGAIADVSAARLVTNTENVSLIRTLYSSLFKRNSNGIFPRLGDAWRDAKLEHLYDFYSNCQKFHLFGDPTLRLLIPQNVALVDSIYVDGRWTMTSDSVKIKSLGRVRVAGTVRQRDTTMTLFNGKSTLQLFDTQKEVVIQEGIGTFRFKVSGSPLYRGEVSITNGHYISTIPIPKDVTFGGSARISIYTWNDQTDGVGYAENVIINGVDSTADIDTVGPRIEVYLNDLSFHAGDVVKSNPTLIIRLEDESGINTSTVGVGHQLFATISNPERTFDLSGYYHSDLDKYQSGEVRYPLRDLSDGKYTLRIKAWDIQNNSSETETFFEVYSADDFALLHVFNYPNPFSSSTTFTFQRNTTDPIDIEVKIYSIAGRYIQNIKMQSIKDSFVKIPWDGKDNDGSEIANGVYFYKVIIQSQDGIRTRETIGKCALIR